MKPPLVAMLVSLGLFLFVGLVTVFSAAAREARFPRRDAGCGDGGGARDRDGRERLILALGLTRGRAWWNAVDRAHAKELFRPLHVAAAVVDSAGASWVRLDIDDPAGAAASGRR